jgi:DNA polymerase elongation subunit (family B)
MVTIDGVKMSDDDALLYQKYIQQAAYADRLQYVFKIKLNSLYGAMSNLYFRFYDLRMGESTTATGRAILLHQCRKVSELLDGNYNVDFPLYETPKECIEKGIDVKFALHGDYFNSKHQSDSVVYGDTDSTYFKTHQKTTAEAIVVADYIGEQVNNSYGDFMRSHFLCTPGFDNLVKAAREIVSDNGIFVQKKRYMLHLRDVDGKTVDKMKVMGLDTKKTILPKEISLKLNAFMEDWLKGKEWDRVAEEIVAYKDFLIHNGLIIKYGLPTGVNNVDQYTALYLKEGMKARLPGGVAAAIHYNQCLAEFGDKISIPITSGMKIKKFYLKRPRGKFKTIALPTDLDEIPPWFADFEIDNQAMITRLVDKPVSNIIKAVGKLPPTKQTLLDTKLVRY